MNERHTSVLVRPFFFVRHMAAVSGLAPKIISNESSGGALLVPSATVARLGNALPRTLEDDSEANRTALAKCEIFRSHPEDVMPKVFGWNSGSDCDG